jgi:Secretion system C-terminal sorting domain
MKKYILYFIAILCFFVPKNSFAQIIPFFETPFYFEDAVGNQDTLILGFQPGLGSIYNLQPEYGEVLDNTPFDSVFEVRAFHSDDSYYRMSKKIIGSAEGSPVLLYGGVSIAIQARYPPITVSYDSSAINLTGLSRNSVLSSDVGVAVFPEWFYSEWYYCLNNSDNVVINLSPPPISQGVFQLFTEIEIPIEGGQQLKLPYFWWTSYLYGTCDSTHRNISTEQPMGTDGQSIRILPNPATQEVEVQFESPQSNFVTLRVFDLAGKLIENAAFNVQKGQNSKQLSVGLHPRGSYWVVIEQDGQLYRSQLQLR